MKKIIVFVVLIMFLAVSGVFGASRFNKLIYPLVVEDEWGYKIKFFKPPQRIISCMPSITEMLFALGLEKKIVGVTSNCDYPEAAKKKPKVGKEKMNIEKIVSLKPDLVVMLGSAQREDIRKARKFRLPVFVINPNSVDDVMISLWKLGTATNRQHAAYSITERIKRRLKWIEVRIKKTEKSPPTVFVEVWHRPLTTASKGTFIDDVIGLSGGINIAHNTKGKYPTYSMEKLIKIDPDVIIIPEQNVHYPKDIYRDFKWAQLTAIKEKRVLFIDADILSRPGPRIIKAIEEIMEFIYEEGNSSEEE